VVCHSDQVRTIGALATFAALDIRTQVLDTLWQTNQSTMPLQLITFGEPRAGNIQFASYYNSFHIPTWRVTNMNDVVVHLPLTGLLDTRNDKTLTRNAKSVSTPMNPGHEQTRKTAVGFVHHGGEIFVSTPDTMKQCQDPLSPHRKDLDMEDRECSLGIPLYLTAIAPHLEWFATPILLGGDGCQI
jgi:hypothetical protein